MDFILTTVDKNRYRISEDVKNLVCEAVFNGEKFVTLNGDLVPLHITPSIVNVDKWISDMDDSLIKVKRRICRKCMRGRDIEGFCECKDTGKMSELAYFAEMGTKLSPPNQKLLK